MPATPTRTALVELVRRHSIDANLVRVELAVMLLVTTATGLCASFGLLAAGLDNMAVRYPLVVALAYAAFLLQLKLWLWKRLQRERRHAARERRSSRSFLDDLSGGGGGGSGGSGPEIFRGRGGGFGGAGASAGWSPMGAAGSPDTAVRASRRSSLLDAGSDSGDDDGGRLVALLALIVFALAVLAVFAVAIVTAPELFSEILADALLAGGLYRGARGLERAHWLRTALRRTLVPIIALMGIAFLLGLAIEHVIPGARWIGDAFARRG